MRHSTQKTQGLVGFAKGAPFGGGLVVGGFGRDAAMTVSNFANVLPDAAPVTVGAGGTVTLTCSDVIGALTINGGTVNLGVNGGTVQMTAATQALSLAGNVTATSDASGSATISGGRVSLGSTARIFIVSDGPQAQDLTRSPSRTLTATAISTPP